MKSNIIISESERPLWQIPIAALFFSIAAFILLFALYNISFNEKGLILFLHRLEPCIYFVSVGIAFTFTKSIHIDVKNSKFRPTINLGPIKLGRWQKIENYEYVSVFAQPLQDGGYIFEVNLWYDRNKHFELYEENDYKEAFIIGYELSEELNIDLLDATERNNYKWIDKDEWKAKMKANSQV